jgi:glycosyltransferase involved in cell wall biosynthesis
MSMRILYFNYLYDIRGASLGSAVKPMELFSAMQQMGHETRLVWFKDNPTSGSGAAIKARSLLKPVLARFMHEPKLFLENWSFMRREAREVEAFKPDILIARLDLNLFSAVKIAQKFNLPLIIEADCPPLYEAVTFQKQYWRIQKISRRIEYKTLHAANAIVAQSNQLRHYLISRYQLNPFNIFMVSNGADPHKFQPCARNTELMQKLNLNDAPVVGFVGSMSIWHGIQNMAELIQQILDVYPQCQFLLVGAGGGLDSAMKKFIAACNLQKQVILTGYVPYEQIPAYLNLMDVVVAPYLGLPFFYYSPVKLFEYMAAGKAIVTTNIGQISEIMKHNQHGLLCRPDNFQDILQNILKLLDDPELREKLGRQARQNIMEHHSWQHKAQAWADICERVLAEKRL